MKKLSNLTQVLSYLEPEGQGCGIIMGVTHLLHLTYVSWGHLIYCIALYWGV
jgi:hypothetical protein